MANPLPLRRSWFLDDIPALPGTTIFEHVKQQLPPSGRGPLPLGGNPLPDAARPAPDQLAWMAGALDGVMSMRGGDSKGNEPLAAAAALLAAIRSTKPVTTQIHSVAAAVSAIDDPHAIDRFIGAVREGKPLQRPRVASLARWLCRSGTSRAHVKAGLALLGISGEPDDAALIKLLGLAEELTLYSAVALRNLLPEPDAEVLDLGQQVGGWGRIHCIHRLRDTQLPEARYWMVHGGYRNGVMDEEVAYVAATTGGLLNALQNEPDEEILDHAGALIAALCTGGPAEDMSNYTDGVAVLQEFLRRMASARQSLARAHCLRIVGRYLNDDDTSNPFLDAKTRQTLAAEAQAILDRSEWSEIVRDALQSSNFDDVRHALNLAKKFGVDPLPTARDWLVRTPHDGFLWQILLDATDNPHLDDLIAQAAQLLPFDALPTGQGDELGIGSAYRANSCLDLILQRLKGAPGQGWSAIQTGLNSPVTRTRNMALRALATWPHDTWPPESREMVQAIAWRDPNKQVRERARQVDNGERPS